jgi:hypothetical protein
VRAVQNLCWWHGVTNMYVIRVCATTTVSLGRAATGIIAITHWISLQ